MISPPQNGFDTMKEKIIEYLRKIEPDKGVRILYACESGSRAWGFPSIDSDYDVRFIYIHPIEWMQNEQLDITGWDLRKALRLLRKGNPPLIEWLNSPIVYMEHFSVAPKMRKYLKKTILLFRVCTIIYIWPKATIENI